MSTLKHNIRQQQAQLHNLENQILRGPRPLPPGMISPPRSPDQLSSELPPQPPQFSTPQKIQKRSSFDVLHSMAPDSNLPLPRRDLPPSQPSKQEGGIPEGIPVDFGGQVSPNSYKRMSSPTRTLSRTSFLLVSCIATHALRPVRHSSGLSRFVICHFVRHCAPGTCSIPIGNARALADEGQRTPKSPVDGEAATPSTASTSALQPPPSPNHRLSLTPGGTTKVLADLQTGVMNARNALENTKAQLRLSQRSVAQLTRQTEDLKEGRERLRLENEGLNNVVARKERLLQEVCEVRPRAFSHRLCVWQVLERARKAEAEAAVLKAQLKTEMATSKKSLREMEAALSESSALSQKSEREYVTLRDSIKSMADNWKVDTDNLREEMRKREEKWRKEAELVGQKYRQLVEDVKTVEEDRANVKSLLAEDRKISKEVENGFQEEVEKMKAEIERWSRESDEAGETAK
jgi:hypothetical protein